jgi:hypothetical protein
MSKRKHVYQGGRAVCGLGVSLEMGPVIGCYIEQVRE